jgi:hypothetical protein
MYSSCIINVQGELLDLLEHGTMFWKKCPVSIFRAEVRRLPEVFPIHPKDLTVD